METLCQQRAVEMPWLSLYYALHLGGGTALDHVRCDPVYISYQAEAFERPDQVVGEIDLPPAEPMEG